MKTHSNPQLYRKLQEPFASVEVATIALEGFADELKTIREKYKLADIVCVIQLNCLDANMEEGQMTQLVEFGDPMKKPAMLARALGKLEAENQAEIAKLLRRK